MIKVHDPIIESLKTAKRNSKHIELLYKTLAKSAVFTLIKPGRREFIINEVVEGAKLEYIACFSNQSIADLTLRYFMRLAGNRGIAAHIQPTSALKLFFSAATRGFPVYLNPKNRPEERFLFDSKKVKSFLVGPWALGDGSASLGEPALKRSRHGRRTVDDEYSQISIADIDFEHYYTASQLAGIFGESENEVNSIISDFVRDEVFALEEVSVAVDDSTKAGRSRAARYYEPWITFLVGNQINNSRGQEFKAFQAKLLSEYHIERNAASAENAGLKNQIMKLEQTNRGLAAEILAKGNLEESRIEFLT